MSWWFRLRRLWGQDRIRLSRQDLRQPRLRVGDRLEVFGELWKVDADISPAAKDASADDGRTPGGSVTRRRRPMRLFRLVHLARPQRTATLCAADDGEAPWVVEENAGRRRVCWRQVIHYGVGQGASVASRL